MAFMVPSRAVVPTQPMYSSSSGVIGSEDRQFLATLPAPLKRPQQDILMKWFCRLRGLRKLSATVPVETLARRTGVSVDKLRSLVLLSLRLEQTLVKVNMRLVASIALQHVGKGMDLDDLVYEGVRGLRKASEKFDLEKGYAFSTYAYPWIKEFIRAALASALPITLPRHVYKLLSKVRAIKSRLSTELGRVPSEQELALEMGISIDRFEVVRKAIALADRSNGATPLVPLELPLPYDESTWEPIVTKDSEGSFVENIFSKELPPDASASMALQSPVVLEALQSLPEEESMAILKRLEYSRVGGGSSTEGKVGLEEGAGSKVLYQKGVRRLRRKIISGRLSLDSKLFLNIQS